MPQANGVHRSIMAFKDLVSLWGLFAGVFLLLAGGGAQGSAIPLRLGAAGVDNVTVGLIATAYFVGLVGGSFYAHRLIAQVGHIRAFAAFASLLSAAALGYPFAIAAVPWAGLRLAQGFCLAGVFMCVESWLNGRATRANRGQVLSFYMVAAYLGQAAGQFVLPLPDSTGFGLFVIASVLMSLAVVPVTISRGPAPPLPNPKRLGMRQLLATSPLGVASALIAGVIIGAFYGLGPLFTQQIGMDTEGTSHFMALAILGGTLLQWPVGKLSDRLDRRRVLLAVTAGVGATALAAAAAHAEGGTALIVIAPLLGGLMFLIYPLGVALAFDRASADDVVAVSGAMVTAYGVGAAAGPFGAGMAMTALGPAGLMMFIAAVALGSAAFGLWRLHVRDAVPTAKQGSFQPMPRTTPIAGVLDPRAPEAAGEPEPATAAPGAPA